MAGRNTEIFLSLLIDARFPPLQKGVLSEPGTEQEKKCEKQSEEEKVLWCWCWRAKENKEKENTNTINQKAEEEGRGILGVVVPPPNHFFKGIFYFTVLSTPGARNTQEPLQKTHSKH